MKDTTFYLFQQTQNKYNKNEDDVKLSGYKVRRMYKSKVHTALLWKNPISWTEDFKVE